eukprot:8305511-Alexandrium_andersonii.AAC.1
MSASLVGSEMCIRDRSSTVARQLCGKNKQTASSLPFEATAWTDSRRIIALFRRPAEFAAR